MSNNIKYAINNNAIVVNFDGETYSFSNGTTEYDEIKSAIKDGRMDDIYEIVAIANKIETYSDGEFIVKDGIIYLDDNPVPSALSSRILEFQREDLPYQPLVNFARKLAKNPSYRSVQQLFQFLDTNKHPITDEGNFVAYKYVKADFTDKWTGKFDNSIGSVVEIPRNAVNDNPEEVCSNGLHVASFDYAHNIYGSGGDGHTLEVEVDPADVVSVPVDHNSAKMRVCRYTVVGISKEPINKKLVNRNESKEPIAVTLDDDECCPACGDPIEGCECEICEGCGELLDDCYCDDYDEG